ncbi:MAG: aminomethyl-transferring glycine dehydrogenase subunit GcvPB, partial [Candidatus Sumerlaeota bacterium]|nr:aminomethyl-transferring glycine dehydrogenase subunit GcvPB [Candidatus Sumerlaeota bacterium]
LGVDNTFYPLGSCTMKYNPRANEDVAALEGLASTHPYQPPDTAQGTLEILWELAEALKAATGLGAVSLQPAAGAHGELACLMTARAYFRSRGEHRPVIAAPDTSHGTNPASAARAGFQVKTIPSDERGRLDVAKLDEVLGPDFGALMITNPNTLGLFEDRIAEAARRVHAAGGLVFMDGANFNAIVGKARPADFGVDLMHINLHKTFSTPHGGGGPGAGPIAAAASLERFLPGPLVAREADRFVLRAAGEESAGRVRAFFGNVAVLVRAWAYVRALGPEGLRAASESAVLNANYLLARLAGRYAAPYGRRCMHEFVLSAAKEAKAGATALDIAKRLIDYGFHPPTVYFPLIVKEALMIEPTESESPETLDAFARVMLEIRRQIDENPGILRAAPQTTSRSRFDEYQAALKPVLRWRPGS